MTHTNILSEFFKDVIVIEICDALRDLVSFAQFKKRERHPLRSITFSKVPA